MHRASWVAALLLSVPANAQSLPDRSLAAYEARLLWWGCVTSTASRLADRTTDPAETIFENAVKTCFEYENRYEEAGKRIEDPDFMHRNYVRMNAMVVAAVNAARSLQSD